MSFVVENESGLNIRSAVRLMQVASEFQSAIMLSAKSTSSSAKSLLSFLRLRPRGTELTVVAEGSCAIDALLAVSNMSWLSGLKPSLK